MQYMCITLLLLLKLPQSESLSKVVWVCVLENILIRVLLFVKVLLELCPSRSKMLDPALDKPTPPLLPLSEMPLLTVVRFTSYSLSFLPPYTFHLTLSPYTFHLTLSLFIYPNNSFLFLSWIPRSGCCRYLNSELKLSFTLPQEASK